MCGRTGSTGPLGHTRPDLTPTDIKTPWNSACLIAGQSCYQQAKLRVSEIERYFQTFGIELTSIGHSTLKENERIALKLCEYKLYQSSTPLTYNVLSLSQVMHHHISRGFLNFLMSL